MDERDDPGHEPEQTHDRDFAPVNRGSDARGRTVPGTSVPVSVPGEDADAQGPGSSVPGEEGMGRQEDEISGTGAPGVEVGHPDALPPDEDGVRDAERHDDSRS
ncbi:hypothetical protein [Actinomadura rubrisoli]|uniref:DUF5709 domain-containing protein n=1 Tax=Actinomadura rubrisoli TaxID=2530368 RepID=A0A4R5AX21_9ACTN|nr:hypothetical protein [Actinomadura rubrisoli]TDD78048.1 hypothetical protein E1298_29015 [Actinomadura rubrisoli]